MTFQGTDCLCYFSTLTVRYSDLFRYLLNSSFQIFSPFSRPLPPPSCSLIYLQVPLHGSLKRKKLLVLFPYFVVHVIHWLPVRICVRSYAYRLKSRRLNQAISLRKFINLFLYNPFVHTHLHFRCHYVNVVTGSCGSHSLTYCMHFYFRRLACFYK